jgi:hypothetical protein
MMQQHSSVLAQQTFPFEGRELEDEVGRGRSGKDGIPQGSFQSIWNKMDKNEDAETSSEGGTLWAKLRCEIKDGKERRT